MGAAVSSGGRVLVCAARYSECQNAYIIEGQHNIQHVLTPCMSQRDGFGLPAHAQNKRKAQRHLLSAIERHPSRRAGKGRSQKSSLALKREAWDHIHDDLALKLAEEPSRPLGMVVRDEQQQRQAVRDKQLRAAPPQNAHATLQVDVEIKAKNEKEAKKVAADLTPSDINKELSAAGLKCW
jgi:hypothetical protein